MEERAIKAFKILSDLQRNQRMTPKEAIAQVTQLGYVWKNEEWIKYQQVNLEDLTFANAVAYLHNYDVDPIGNLILEDEVARFNRAIDVISAATGLSSTWLGGVLFTGEETIESLKAAATADPLYPT